MTWARALCQDAGLPSKLSRLIEGREGLAGGNFVSVKTLVVVVVRSSGAPRIAVRLAGTPSGPRAMPRHWTLAGRNDGTSREVSQIV